MLVHEYKIDGKSQQFQAIEEAIRVVQFIRNKCIRLWMDGERVSKNDLQIHCALLAQEFPFAHRLNSQARQASADRAWFAISRFYENCREHKPGKKGYPQFQHDNRSVEYKQTGWKLEPDGKHITFTDGCGIGRLRLVGNKKQKIETFPIKDIKRVRIVRRADGYYCQFCIKTERKVEHVPTGREVGIDVGLKSYLTDSEGNTVDNPRHYRKAEKRLKRLHRRHSRKQKTSANRKEAQKQRAKGYLKVQRQREDFACKQANALVKSHDLIAYEHLQIRNMIRNRKVAKSIQDAGWGIFLQWLAYYGFVHAIPIIAVPPHFTSQNCSACGTTVQKSLSVRTHICPNCGLVMDRDQNAAKNILEKALSSHRGCTGGHSETDGLAP
ncbi:MAG TPA: transposase [Ktedonobacteraceae bacterium]|nr:transposase [Ktedonobacteraceae bacterium]